MKQPPHFYRLESHQFNFLVIIYGQKKHMDGWILKGSICFFCPIALRTLWLSPIKLLGLLQCEVMTIGDKSKHLDIG